MQFQEWLSVTCIFHKLVKEITELEQLLLSLKGRTVRRKKWEVSVKLRRLQAIVYSKAVNDDFCGICAACLQTNPKAITQLIDI